MQNWSILAKFAKKNPAKLAVFYWLFLGEDSPRNFLGNQLIFLRICPWKSSEIWLFSAKIPRNRPIFSTFSDFSPAKSANFSVNFDSFPVKIPRNWPIFPQICPWKSCEIVLIFPRNKRSPDLILKILKLSQKLFPPKWSLLNAQQNKKTREGEKVKKVKVEARVSLLRSKTI